MEYFERPRLLNHDRSNFLNPQHADPTATVPLDTYYMTTMEDGSVMTPRGAGQRGGGTSSSTYHQQNSIATNLEGNNRNFGNDDGASPPPLDPREAQRQFLSSQHRRGDEERRGGMGPSVVESALAADSSSLNRNGTAAGLLRRPGWLADAAIERHVGSSSLIETLSVSGSRQVSPPSNNHSQVVNNFPVANNSSSPTSGGMTAALEQPTLPQPGVPNKSKGQDRPRATPVAVGGQHPTRSITGYDQEKLDRRELNEIYSLLNPSARHESAEAVGAGSFVPPASKAREQDYSNQQQPHTQSSRLAKNKKASSSAPSGQVSSLTRPTDRAAARVASPRATVPAAAALSPRGVGAPPAARAVKITVKRKSGNSGGTSIASSSRVATPAAERAQTPAQLLSSGGTQQHQQNVGLLPTFLHDEAQRLMTQRRSTSPQAGGQNTMTRHSSSSSSRGAVVPIAPELPQERNVATVSSPTTIQRIFLKDQATECKLSDEQDNERKRGMIEHNLQVGDSLASHMAMLREAQIPRKIICDGEITLTRIPAAGLDDDDERGVGQKKASNSSIPYCPHCGAQFAGTGFRLGKYCPTCGVQL